MELPAKVEPRSVAPAGKTLVAPLSLAAFLLHIILNGRYGYFVDELYYVACSHHLAWGYVDQPPLIAVVTWITRLSLGDSLHALRFFPAVAAGLKVLLTGLIARELGGKRFAQALACLAVIGAPLYLGIDNLLTMNAFEPLFWMGCAYVSILILKGGSAKLWLLFGLLAGVGLENKHSMLLFGFAFVIGLLLTPERRFLRSPWPWLGGLLALVIFLPNLLWEIRHDFPTLELLRNVRASGRNVSLSPVDFLLQEIVLLQPLACPLWLAGLWYYLGSAAGKRFRVLGWTFLVILACMLMLHGRVYYLVPAYPMLFAAGAIAFDNFAERRHWVWLKLGYVAVLVLTSVVFAPFALPVLPVRTYIRYSQVLDYEPPRLETHRLGPLPQVYADQFGWREMAEAVAGAYNRLSPEDRARCAIFGQNYGQAGAIDFFGPPMGLPKAISGHQTYFLWGPRGYTGECVIVMADRPERLGQLFDHFEKVGTVYHPYSMPYEHFDVYLCRGLHWPLKEVWPKVKNWD